MGVLEKSISFRKDSMGENMNESHKDIRQNLEQAKEIENSKKHKTAERKTFPNHKLYTYIGKDKKRKIVLVYNRNNLSKKDFSKINKQEWQLKGNFEENNIKIEYCITVSEDINNIFMFNDKQIKIRGGLNHFGIAIKRKGNEIPWEINKNLGNVNCHIKCTGSYKGIRQRKRTIERRSISINIGRRPLEINSGNSWRALHPYSGGNCRSR